MSLSPLSSIDSAPRRQVVARIANRIPVLAEEIVAGARDQMSSYAALSQSAVTGNVGMLIERIMTALYEQRDLGEDDCARLREYGELRAQQGIPLVDVQNGWRIALRRFRTELMTEGREHRVPDHDLLEISHRMLDLVDQAAAAFGQGHREVELELARHDHQVRAEFVRRVLLGQIGPAGIRLQAHQFGLDLDADYHPFRARVHSRETYVDLRQWLRASCADTVLVTTIDADIAGFTTTPEGLRTEVPIGFGPPARLAELDRSFRLASRLLLTADVFGLTGPTDLERAGLLAAVVADNDIGAELAATYVHPVGTGEQARTIVDTVETHLDTGMRIEKTAELLVVHPNTIRYRISRYEELTGADLRSPVTAARVWWAIKHRRASGRR